MIQQSVINPKISSTISERKLCPRPSTSDVLKLTPKPLDLFDLNRVRRLRVGCHLMILPVEPADRRTLKQR